MNNYIKAHNIWIRSIEENLHTSNTINEDHLNYHNMKLGYLQHERIIHLLILIFTGILCITFFILTFAVDQLLIYLLLLIFIILFIFYVRYYYLLENTVQKWYFFSTKLYEYIYFAKKEELSN